MHCFLFRSEMPRATTYPCDDLGLRLQGRPAGVDNGRIVFDQVRIRGRTC
ncbi:hypothetical protein I552_0406 [Mycobacterium xenopi 3993]|nr:hypothetical protein I552_0406 [Mycobacterium xenopi 3993]